MYALHHLILPVNSELLKFSRSMSGLFFLSPSACLLIPYGTRLKKALWSSLVPYRYWQDGLSAREKINTSKSFTFSVISKNGYGLASEWCTFLILKQNKICLFIALAKNNVNPKIYCLQHLPFFFHMKIRGHANKLYEISVI